MAYSLSNFFGLIVELNLSVLKLAHTGIPNFFLADSTVFLCMLVFLINFLMYICSYMSDFFIIK